MPHHEPTRPLSTGSIVDLRVEKTVHGGDGLGWVHQQACFVRRALPGERVRVRIITRKRDYLRAVVQDILEPSPGRRIPACPVFGQCGGCQWQHAAYDLQLDMKQAILEEAFRRIAGFTDVPVSPLHPAPAEFNYRSRLRAQVSRTGNTPMIGFFRYGSHDVVPVQACMLAAPGINDALAAFSTAAAHDPALLRGAESVEARYSCHEQAVLLMCFKRGRAVRSRLRHDCRTRELSADRSSSLIELCGGLQFLHSGTAFTQVNHAQNQYMIDTVMDALQPGPGMKILDLFCGSGNFSLILAHAGASVTGIEASAAAVALARRNARLNDAAGCRFVCADANTADFTRFGTRWDVVILNPPRAGCAQSLLQRLCRGGSQRLVYVSCNPATLARDCAVLRAGGYAIAQILPLDMFPQTSHVETICILDRSAL